ncbi:MAG: serine/threonine protein kinase, AGC [Caeruleum heppii]|nr:MAG: serine/threonine protein kinase, AGC [Caeruleum heppii]
MATATVQKAAAALRRDMFPKKSDKPDISSHEPQNLQDYPDERGESGEAARDQLAQLSSESRLLPPTEIDQDPAEKQLGKSSRNLQLSDFELLRTLGTGTFARVWLARLTRPGHEDIDANKVFALKILRKADVIKLKQVEHVQNEREILAAVAGHPFITTLIASFADHDCLYMLLDYCPGGEVFTYLRRAKRFDTPTTQFYAAEILLILEFLHEHKGVVYRDMKPENLLIDAEGHIKLVDFGFAKKLGDRETYTLCGTPEYLAPEVIQSKGHDISVDWWAFGILIYEFLVGQPPFWDQNPMKIYEKIVNDTLRFPRGMPPAAEDMIRLLCTKDRSRRLGNLAAGAADVKQHPFFEGIDWDALYYRRMRGPIVPKVQHAADSSNFDEYPAEKSDKEPYTEELRRKHEDAFRDF